MQHVRLHLYTIFSFLLSHMRTEVDIIFQIFEELKANYPETQLPILLHSLHKRAPFLRPQSIIDKIEPGTNSSENLHIRIPWSCTLSSSNCQRVTVGQPRRCMHAAKTTMTTRRSVKHRCATSYGYCSNQPMIDRSVISSIVCHSWVYGYCYW